MIRYLLLGISFSVVFGGLPFAQMEEPADPWGPLRHLVGAWEGEIDGPLGTGSGVREYEFILEENFLLSRHASVRPPQERSPKGDHHREMGLFSYDGQRKTIVYRQFVSEGFVNQYMCDVGAQRFVCTTEAVENAPGLRARWTVEIPDRYSFEETFELAWPGKELSVLFTNRWKRQPVLD